MLRFLDDHPQLISSCTTPDGDQK